MGLFVTITRYKPEQVEALEKRWDTMLNGTAPKPVMDAMAKMKVIAQVVSPQNGFGLEIVDVTDETWVDGSLICRYMADVCSMECYPVCSMEQWLKVKERLPLAKIPKK